MCTVYKNVQPALSNFEKKKKRKKMVMMMIMMMVMICVTQKSVLNQIILSLLIFQVLVLGAFLKCL